MRGVFAGCPVPDAAGERSGERTAREAGVAKEVTIDCLDLQIVWL